MATHVEVLIKKEVSSEGWGDGRLLNQSDETNYMTTCFKCSSWLMGLRYLRYQHAILLTFYFIMKDLTQGKHVFPPVYTSTTRCRSFTVFNCKKKNIPGLWRLHEAAEINMHGTGLCTWMSTRCLPLHCSFERRERERERRSLLNQQT